MTQSRAALRVFGRSKLMQSRLGLGGDAAALESDVLLACALRITREELLIRPNSAAAPELCELFREFIARRCTGEPVAYILGVKEFYSLRFAVNRSVLIPRPETEFVVEHGLGFLRQRTAGHGPLNGGYLVLDVGTGSGAIVVSLACALRKESGEEGLSRGMFIGLDCSFAALKVAKSNALAHGLEDHISFAVSDVLSAVRVKPERHGAVLIVSNPPYISDSEELSFQISGFEPKCALRAGEKGLDVIERLIREAAPILRQKGPLGALVMEIGAGQDSDVRCIAQREELTTINYIQDLRGVKRVVEVGK